MKGTTKVGSYNITAEMDGIPGNLKTEFHSEPYLNDSQILMLLTLHANPEGDNTEAIKGALFNAGLTMSWETVCRISLKKPSDLI